jgi:tRNA(fMet)-specific endonuclease VapC
MMRALDTNIIVELLRSRDPELQERFLSRPPGEYSVPEMVRAELLHGALMSRRAAENLAAVERFLEPLKLLPFRGDAAIHYAEIRSHLERDGSPIGPNDLVIAATARSSGHAVVTRNCGEYQRVPELAVEMW